MSRIFSISSAILLSLLPAVAFTAPAHKQHIRRWHGYGFLPGYHQPPNNSIPVFDSKRSARRETEHNYPSDYWYRDYTPSYWYNGEKYYLGYPGFFRGRYNGGSFGPCWTWTPIGPIWNCG